MAKGNLTNEQNIRSAIIFLNTFGLKLEEKDNLDENTKLKIINANDEQVGELYFDGDSIKMKALCAFGSLKAEYKKAAYDGEVDAELGKVKYAKWHNTINYSIEKNAREKFSGDVIFETNFDDDYGYIFFVRPLIRYYLDDKERIKMRFFRDSRYIDIEIKDKDNKVEEIDFSSILYNIIYGCNSNGSYDFKNTEEYSVRVYKSKLIGVDRVVKNGKVISQEEIEEPQESCSGADYYIQQGKLMQRINPNMVKKIADIENLFKAENVNLLNNFLNVSLHGHFGQDEGEFSDVIFALLGVEVKPVVYQNGSTNQYDAYFGIGDDTFDMPVGIQKKLKSNN